MPTYALPAALLLVACGWPRSQYDHTLIGHHGAPGVTVVSICEPPCCAVDFDAGVATDFPESCWQ